MSIWILIIEYIELQLDQNYALFVSLEAARVMFIYLSAIIILIIIINDRAVNLDFVRYLPCK